jgi:hypothetical protein
VDLFFSSCKLAVLIQVSYNIFSFFPCVFVYFAAGIAIKKFKFHAEGKELIPNVEFWASLPGLVKVGDYRNTLTYFYRMESSLSRTRLLANLVLRILLLDKLIIKKNKSCCLTL